MKRSSILVVFLMTILAGLSCSARAASRRSKVGTLKGRISVTPPGRETLPPSSATVFVMFSSGMHWDSLQRGTFSNERDLGTAGGQFAYHMHRLLSRNKDLKRLMKYARKESDPRQRMEDALQIGRSYLQTTDEALALVRAWLAKHPGRSWQMETVMPNGQGLWSAAGLQPGSYEIVVRGRVLGYDADWEASVDLEPGKTLSIPLTQARFFARQE